MDAAPSRRHSVTIAARRLTPVALLFRLRVPFMVKPLQARIHHKYNVRYWFSLKMCQGRPAREPTRKMRVSHQTEPALNVKMPKQTLIRTRTPMSSNSLIKAGVVLLLAFFLLPVAAQQRQTLSRLEFVGLKRLTRDQVVTMSGLKIGQSIDQTILDAAAGELLKSGLFRK